ncbi:MAG: hypothetical protein RLY43_540, partial [Bacteroidota bacterium]
MKTDVLKFVEDDILHKLAHYLPAQNPLKDFVHHNTLHAFQDKPFFEALQEASELFGYKTFLSLYDFRKLYTEGAIEKNILLSILSKRKGEAHTTLWLDKLTQQVYDESNHPNIGKLRANWKLKYAINLEKSTHGLLFRILCSYLDQGISMWPFPVHQKGFLASLKELDKNGITSFLETPRAKKFLHEDKSVSELLHILVGNDLYFENYLFDQQFSHPGWSGMVATLEHNPTSLLDQRKITLR